MPAVIFTYMQSDCISYLTYNTQLNTNYPFNLNKCPTHGKLNSTICTSLLMINNTEWQQNFVINFKTGQVYSEFCIDSIMTKRSLKVCLFFFENYTPDKDYSNFLITSYLCSNVAFHTIDDLTNSFVVLIVFLLVQEYIHKTNISK